MFELLEDQASLFPLTTFNQPRSRAFFKAGSSTPSPDHILNFLMVSGWGSQDELFRGCVAGGQGCLLTLLTFCPLSIWEAGTKASACLPARPYGQCLKLLHGELALLISG